MDSDTLNTMIIVNDNAYKQKIEALEEARKANLQAKNAKKAKEVSDENKY